LPGLDSTGRARRRFSSNHWHDQRKSEARIEMLDWREEIRQRLASLNLEPAREAEIVEELAQHLEDRQAELLSGGATDEEALRVALAELSGSDLLRRELRRVEQQIKNEPPLLGARRRNVMEDLYQDLRYSIRTLLKHPGVTAIAVITLALGIGANTALFSVVNAVLLRPLPFKESDRLVWVSETILNLGVKDMSVAPPTFIDWQAQQQNFDELTAYSTEDFILTGQGEPERIHAAAVSSSYLSMLAGSPAAGRFFGTEEDRVGGEPAVVLSHVLWRTRFNADPNILGNAITLDGASYEIIGVAPRDFTAPNGVAMWVPLMPRIADSLTIRGAHYLQVIGRLKLNRTATQAETELNEIAHRIAESDSSYQGYGARVISQHHQITGNVQQALLILFVAVGFVLLIACANVANILLAQATTRQREVAIRLALGASRGRLIRQLLTESVTLSAIGGTLGLLLAVWGTDLLVALSASNLPRTEEIAVNARVILFSLLVSIGTGLIFGLAPALQATKTDLTSALKEGGVSVTAGLFRNRLRGLLVITEVALTCVLLIGAGLMVNSFARLLRVNPGFSPASVSAFKITLPRSKYAEKTQQVGFFQGLTEHIAAMPGVRAVGAINNLPASGQGMTSPVTIEGKPGVGSDKPKQVQYAKVQGDYFLAMGIPLLRSRLFTERDNPQAPPVMVINEALARQFFPDEDPIGKKMKTMFQGRGMREIIGVVGDVHHSGPLKDAPPQVYEPYQENPTSSLTVIVQAETPHVTLAAAVRSAVQSLDKDQPVDRIVPMSELLADSIAEPRFYTLLLAIFAAIAFALAAVGIYGVMSYAVTQRTHEIGIRMALGAQTADVLKLVVRNGMVLAVAGVAIGLAGAFALTRLMTKLLFGVTPTDVLTFAAVSALLIVVALLACYIPARRASKVDPLVALRYE
jgi:putative ABC transport system permease protein